MGIVVKKKSSKSSKMRGGANSGTYTFTDDDNISFFSDIEGNMPDGIRNLMFDTGDMPKTLGNEVIVFTGDLIDRGEYTIRNLQRMLALKKANDANVILLCGNRDANKIRMYHECHIQAIEDMILKSENKNKDINAILGELRNIDTVFTNKLESIKEIIDITGINNSGKGFSEIYSDDLSRITKMYSNTLGSPKQIEFFAREFEVLFGFSFGIGEDFWDDKNKGIDKHTDANYNTLLKCIAMMNMVMGKVWNESELPEVLKDYNGLYIKYLQKCHIMASITIGTKLCIVSHAGIPYDEKRGFYIPTEIGVVPSPKTIKEEKLSYGVQITTETPKSNNPHYYNISNIEMLNKGFNDFIERIKGGDRSDLEYKKYVAMSANCDDKVMPYTAYASPIVSQKELEEVKMKEGLSLDKFKKGNITHIYNIFGHQPSGLLPYISKGTYIHTYHIDLDISRAENPIISNKESYVYLRITKDSDMLFGKTDTNNAYHSITGEIVENNLDGLSKTIGKGININYEGYPLQSYCDNVLQATYTTQFQNKPPPLRPFTSTLFTVDNKKYYGSFSWTLVEYNKPVKGGRRKAANAAKAYTKSIKRFLYGKRKMVIYLGKRGGEYVKVKGEYMSLAKFRDKKRI